MTVIIVIRIFIFMVTISSFKVSFRSNYYCDDHDFYDCMISMINWLKDHDHGYYNDGVSVGLGWIYTTVHGSSREPRGGR